MVGYIARNTVQVRTADVAGVGRLLDLAFKLGANTVDRVAFTLVDQEPARTEALRAATAKVRPRATAMAAALGLRLGPVVSISESRGELEDAELFGIEGRRYKRGNTTPIEVGGLQVGASVTVVFAIAR